MTRTELRVEALRLAVATAGNSNKVIVADEYLTFLSKDMEPVIPEGSTGIAVKLGPQQPQQQKGKSK